jgi:hypothetical protein
MRTDPSGQGSERRRVLPLCIIVIILMATLMSGCLREDEDTEVYEEVHGKVERTWTEGEIRHIDFRVMKLEGTYRDTNTNGTEFSSGNSVHLYYNSSKHPEFEDRVGEGNYLLVDFVHRPDEDPDGTYLVRDLEKTSHPFLGDGILIVLILLGASYIIWGTGSKILYHWRNPGQPFISPGRVRINCPVCGKPSSVFVRLPPGSWNVFVKSQCRTCDEKILLHRGVVGRPLFRANSLAKQPRWKRIVILVLVIIALPFTLYISLYAAILIILIVSSLFAMTGNIITLDTMFLFILLLMVLVVILVMRFPASVHKHLARNLDIEAVKKEILERSAKVEESN